MANEQPSVYSFTEIRRHEKRRRRLEALEQGQRSDSDTDIESENANVDPDFDINFRICESSAASVDNKIVGEIRCNVKTDDRTTENVLNNGNDKNSTVFKVSVNANFNENGGEPTAENEESDERKSSYNNDKEVNSIPSMDSLDELTDDSDLEILISKPLVRRRTIEPSKRGKKPIHGSTNGNLTIYDLVHHTVPSKEMNDNMDENEPDKGWIKPKKKETTSPSKRVEYARIRDEARNEEIIETNESSVKVPLGVPQLKVTADERVVVDMDSLIVEETGLSDAINEIANSELIEECRLSHKSYTKKRNLSKQWSPQDTLKFYHVLSTIGTDFSLMATLFPGRTRTCMKRKFKREEKINDNLISKALSSQQSFDLGLLKEELRLRREQVNQLRESSKTQKITKSLKSNEAGKQKRTRTKPKRRSYFESSIKCFQR